MKKKEDNKFNHIQIVERSTLQTYLYNQNYNSLQKIADILNVSRQTLYREILRNSTLVKHDTFYDKLSCEKFLECHKGSNKNFHCLYNCPNYIEYQCPKLHKYPFICDKCKKKSFCKYKQRFYDPEVAQKHYEHELSSSRVVLKTKRDDIKRIDKIISPCIKNGQSIEAVLMNHNEIKTAPTTIRSWIKKGYLNVSYSQLRMTGRRKIPEIYNYSKNKEHVAMSEEKIGHKYPDYLFYIKNHPLALTIQLDTVIGTQLGKKTILTIHIADYHFQFGYLLDEHTPNEVLKKLNEFKNKLKTLDEENGTILYELFNECYLADNGIEFDYLMQMENDNCHVFYTHPNSSYEKGECERNHVLIRYVEYKGKSFDELNQDQVNLLFSHINSYPRKSLKEKTPTQVVIQKLGREFLDACGIKEIPCDDVNLTPSLLHKIKS